MENALDIYCLLIYQYNTESLKWFFWRRGSIAIDYSKEKKEFIAELEAGEYDLEISPNRGMDYRDIEDNDFLTFRENLNSASSKPLIAENFGK